MKTKRRPKLKWLVGGLAVVVIAVVAVVLLSGGSTKKTLPSGGTLKAGKKQQLLPLSPSGRLAGSPGQKVSGSGVNVRSVVKGRGFWVGGSDVDRVFVHYKRAGQNVGKRVDIDGTIKPAPTNVQKSLGLPTRDTAKVTAEGAYIEPKSVSASKSP
jgi:hypothetical protein